MNNQIADKIVQEAIKDPKELYKSPAAVLDDERLNKDQKQTILESWALDQRSLLVAESENMTGSNGKAAEILQDVQDAQAKLKS